MCEKYGAELDDTTLIHSDQGFHYTSRAFIQKLRDKNYVQSMSRRGNCWDNAPQESFFGHMKDDLAKAIAQCETFVEVTELVNDWIDYYNNDRYQATIPPLFGFQKNGFELVISCFCSNFILLTLAASGSTKPWRRM